MSTVDPRPCLPSLASSQLDLRETYDVFVTVCLDFSAAKTAIYRSVDAGRGFGQYSVVRRVGPSDGKATGSSGLGDRTTFWDGCGALWGCLGDLPLAGLMVTILGFGVVLIGGHMAVTLATRISRPQDRSVETGGLGALGAALAGMGLPLDDLSLCRTALEAGDILVLGAGVDGEVRRVGDVPRQAVQNRASVHVAGPCQTPVVARLGRPSFRPAALAVDTVADRSNSSRDTTLQELR